jgi:hypothetical protein
MIKQAQDPSMYAQQGTSLVAGGLTLGASREMTADEKAEANRKHMRCVRAQFIHSQAVTLFQRGCDDPQDCWIRAVKFWESMPDDVRENITRLLY